MFHFFQFGKFKCYVAYDGYATFRTDHLFSSLTAKEKELLNIGSKMNLPFLPLVIYTGKKVILVDTGGGNLYGLAAGKLFDSLKQANIHPDSIDIVINTHTHMDHCAGNCKNDGSPNFPNAIYLMSRKEYETIISKAENGNIHSLRFIKKNFLSISHQTQVIDEKTEIDNGVFLQPSYGHTPGLITVSLKSEGHELVCVSDTIYHPLHFLYRNCYSTFDCSPKDAIISRQKIIENLSKENVYVYGYHFEFPGIGKLSENKFMKKVL